MSLRIPIRTKAVALIAGTLTLSLCAYLYVGTSLIVDDKVSYLFDYNLTLVKSASDVIESSTRKIEASAASIAILSGRPAAMSPNSDVAAEIFERQARPAGADALALLSAGTSGYREISRYGDWALEPSVLAARLSWTSAASGRARVALTTLPDLPRLIVGGTATDSAGQPVTYLAIFHIPSERIAQGRDSSLFLLDDAGRILLKTSEQEPPSELPSFANELLNGQFDSGARLWTTRNQDFVAAYQRAPSERVIVVGLVKKDVAFSAVRGLAVRSVVIGGSILLVSLGLALIFVRRLLDGLRHIWTATQKVGQGDFEFRITLKQSLHDEVSDLSSSFNAMSSKISELVVATAEKARMQKELETAQLIQRRFFPATSFTHPNLEVSGSYAPASECAGDWWSYRAIGDRHLVVALGDVTGHGASAALVTAAVHASYSVYMSELTEIVSPEETVRALLRRLHEVVTHSSGGDSTMTFLVSIFDLSSGEITLGNASHRLPYQFRPSPSGHGGNPLDQLSVIICPNSNALGSTQAPEIKTCRYEITPGDSLILYTDGLVECESPEGQRLRAANLARALEAARATGETARQTCDHLFATAMNFFGGSGARLADDITLVVANIPRNANFARVTPHTENSADAPGVGSDI